MNINEQIKNLIQRLSNCKDNFELIDIKKNLENKLIQDLKNLLQIDFCLKIHIKPKFLVICAKNIKDILKLKQLIKQYNLNLICLDYSYNQLKYYSKLAYHNKKENNNLCGCYNCLMIFDGNNLNNQFDEDFLLEIHDDTFVCPYCLHESLIFLSKKNQLNREFLYQLELFNFGKQINIKDYKEQKLYQLIELNSITIN